MVFNEDLIQLKSTVYLFPFILSGIMKENYFCKSMNSVKYSTATYSSLYFTDWLSVKCNLFAMVMHYVEDGNFCAVLWNQTNIALQRCSWISKLYLSAKTFFFFFF
ncbi:hypothetical protein AB205_0160340 [Aquarana catesbeiana]|uniref:Uncharacterized protein n=1 Tax=Aquarana catesbeiana TaxID=8400 RepID=A0A2G9RQB1_AQUCT|nr:hypothetical protein AB205_0160340 [Aquarana catesbeiana]